MKKYEILIEINLCDVGIFALLFTIDDHNFADHSWSNERARE